VPKQRCELAATYRSFYKNSVVFVLKDPGNLRGLPTAGWKRMRHRKKKF